MLRTMSDNSVLEPREGPRGEREDGLEASEGLAVLVVVVTVSAGPVAFLEVVVYLNLQ